MIAQGQPLPLTSRAATLAQLLPPNPKAGSRKRFRGRKRYYRRLIEQARGFRLPLGEAHWYAFWHYHADWPGYGNLSVKHRLAHLAAHCLVFGNIAAQVEREGYREPYQLWLYLDARDAGQDAVYFHTPNPVGPPFPATFSAVHWGLSEAEQLVGQYLPTLPLRAGVQGPYQGRGAYLNTESGCSSLYVYSTAHGQSLE